MCIVPQNVDAVVNGFRLHRDEVILRTPPRVLTEASHTVVLFFALRVVGERLHFGWIPAELRYPDLPSIRKQSGLLPPPPPRIRIPRKDGQQDKPDVEVLELLWVILSY